MLQVLYKKGTQNLPKDIYFRYCPYLRLGTVSTYLDAHIMMETQ